MAEIGWQRGCAGLNQDNLAYKLRLEEGNNELTRHEQILTCGLALEGGADIVGLLTAIIWSVYFMTLVIGSRGADLVSHGVSLRFGSLIRSITKRLPMMVGSRMISRASNVRELRLMRYMARRLFRRGRTRGTFPSSVRVSISDLANQEGTLIHYHSVIKETLRWRPPLPLAVQHCLTQGVW